MHKLTTDGRTYSLRVDLESYEDEHIFAVYRSFWIGPEWDNYRLHISGYSSSSTAGELKLCNGDSPKLHNEQSVITLFEFSSLE